MLRYAFLGCSLGHTVGVHDVTVAGLQNLTGGDEGSPSSGVCSVVVWTYDRLWSSQVHRRRGPETPPSTIDGPANAMDGALLSDVRLPKHPAA